MAISKSLVVKFLGDATQLKGVYNDVTKDAQKFGKEVKSHGVSMQAVGKIMLAVGGTIVGTMAATVVSVTKSAGEIEHLSRVAGVSAEQFQKLAYAAKQDDIGMESLSNGLTKLSKNMYDAQTGTGEAAKAFVSMGVNVQTADGHLRAVDTVLLDVAEKFKNMNNPAEKAALAMKIFGKSGADLVPFLEQGKDGIAALSDEAQRLGLVISDKAVSGLDKLGDEIDNVKASFGGLSNQIASDLYPYMQSLVDGIKSAVEWFNQIPGPVRQAITVGTAFAGVLLLITGVITTAVIPALATLDVMSGGLIIAIGALVTGLTYLASTNQKAAAIMWDAWDRVGAFLNGAWKGLETSCWALIEEMLKALNTFTGWIPGWGSKLNAAILAVEEQRQASLAARNSEWNTVVKGTYEAHYNWLVERNKKKNDNVTKQDKDAEQQKQLQLKEAQDKAKQAAEERLNNEKEWNDKLFTETHNALENLNHEEELALSKSNMSEKAKADVRAYYVQKRLDLTEEEAKKRLEIEESADTKLKNDTISNLNEIAEDEEKSNTERIAALKQSLALQLELKQTEYEKELKAAEDAGADTTKITEGYDLEKTALEQDAAAKEATIIEDSKKNNRDLISLYAEVERAATDRADAISTESGGIGLEGIANELYDLESQYKDIINGITRYYEDMTNTFAGLTQEQKDQYIKAWTDAGVAFEVINKDGKADAVDLHQQALNEQLAADKQYAADKKEIMNATKVYQERLDEAYNKGNLADYKKLLNSEQSALSQNLAGNRQKLDAYYEVWQASHRSTMSYMAETMQTTFSGLSTFFSDILTGTESISDAWSNLKDTIVEMLAVWVAEWIASKLVMAVFGKATEATSTAASVTEAAATAAAWAPAAAAVSLASWGANAIAADIGMTTSYALSKALSAITALAEGGETTGPSLALIGEGAYSEAVLPLSDDTFERIGEGIIKNQTTNNTAANDNSQSSSSSTVINNNYQLGKYVDKSGLKKLWRDLEPIKTSEDKRKGK